MTGRRGLPTPAHAVMIQRPQRPRSALADVRTDAFVDALPTIIQGGMGAGISGWRLARAVSSEGQLGVVSGTALDVILARRLQTGDPGGHLRRALDRFPVRAMADRVWRPVFRGWRKAAGRALHPRSAPGQGCATGPGRALHRRQLRRGRPCAGRAPPSGRDQLSREDPGAAPAVDLRRHAGGGRLRPDGRGDSPAHPGPARPVRAPRARRVPAHGDGRA